MCCTKMSLMYIVDHFVLFCSLTLFIDLGRIRDKDCNI